MGFFLFEEEDYINRIGVHLNDKTVYNSFVVNLENLVSDIINVITNSTISFKDEIGMTKKIREWDLNRSGNMYLYPKARKPPGTLVSWEDDDNWL